MRTLESLLTEAERLLHLNLEEARGFASQPGGVPNSQQYEQAKALFEEALKLNPESSRAQEGLANCLEMLSPYIPVQYLEPPTALGEIQPLLGEPSSQPAPPQTPWGIRRALRKRQREGMAYTGQAFSAEGKRLRSKAASIVAEAKRMVSSGELSAELAYKRAEQQLKEMQKANNRNWKGQGPSFYPEALSALRKALELSD